MAIKDWKKSQKNHWYNSSNGNNLIVIERTKTFPKSGFTAKLGYNVSLLKNMNSSAGFVVIKELKDEKQALRYTKAYMRKH